MVEFRKYQHVEKFGTTEVEGIELGEVVIFPKLDGTNGSVWLGDDGKIRAGSRKRELSIDDDNAGFYAYISQHKGIRSLLKEHPHWRLYGEWLCLSGDTVIRKTSGGKNGNYMTLREMYAFSQKKIVDTQKWTTKDGTMKENKVKRSKSWWDRKGYPSIFSLYMDEDIIKANKIKGIFYTGTKKVFLVTTRKGYSIKSSPDHLFFTPHGFVALKDLNNNDCVAISPLSNMGRKKRTYGTGTNYMYKTIYEYRDSIGACERCGNTTCLEVHHKDGNLNNNQIENYEVVCVDCHKASDVHKKKFTGFVYGYEFDKIVSIVDAGEDDCYDISMEGEGDNAANFVANGFLVHNCPHSLKTYKDDAWRKFYVFDVLYDSPEDDDVEYIPFNYYQESLDIHGIDYIIPLCTMKNPSYENLVKALESNTFLIKDGKGTGEGIVIKRYDYVNRYGRTTWAKMVTNDFKVKHTKEQGIPEILTKQMVEQRIADIYCTEWLIEKEYQKIATEHDGWHSECIPELLGRVYYELIREECWKFVKELKNPTINFKTLHGLVIQKIKQVKPELF